jgi:hypothetical protein
MPSYVFLLYGRDDAVAWDPDSPAWAEGMAQHAAFTDAVAESGATITGGAALRRPGTARTVRGAGGGRTVFDGPFAETREVLGGFYVIETTDLAAALALAQRCPEEVVEVRPVVEEAG